MSDQGREAWAQNDEGHYRFSSEYRARLDTITAKVKSGEKPAHFLEYGG